jgi:peptidoglycan/LPS O-acetylase OafA/YrhL
MFPDMKDHARLDHVDGLRALAIALVICFHAALPGIPSGFLGVDVFLWFQFSDHRTDF